MKKKEKSHVISNFPSREIKLNRPRSFERFSQQVKRIPYFCGSNLSRNMNFSHSHSALRQRRTRVYQMRDRPPERNSYRVKMSKKSLIDTSFSYLIPCFGQSFFFFVNLNSTQEGKSLSRTTMLKERKQIRRDESLRRDETAGSVDFSFRI